MPSVLDFIGNTPLVRLERISPKPSVKIFVKLEGNNPGGSVKDRAAFSMINGAKKRGELSAGVKLLEATSGNTGIALAMIARLLNVEIELILPANSTKERLMSIKAYGAKVTMKSSMEEARDFAYQKAEKGGYLLLNQFANDDNWRAHYLTTGPEIWADTQGEITHFVSAMGTTGTIMGVSRYLKEKNPNIQVIGVQPTEGSSIPGIRKWPEEYVPKIFDPARVDQTREVSEKQAVEMTRRLAKEEAVFAGMSTGGAAYSALEVANELDEATIVFIACDRGDRYLSSDLFAE